MATGRWIVGAIVGVALVLGAVVAAKSVVDPALYVGAEPQAAAADLLTLARKQAGNGSWQRLRVARVALLGGQTALAETIIAEVEGGKPEPSDWIRIGRIYLEAGDWAKAAPYFDKVLAAKPNDEDWLAEIGAYHNLRGDRARAEELFRRSFELDPESYKNLATAAGSYVGVSPAVDI